MSAGLKLSGLGKRHGAADRIGQRRVPRIVAPKRFVLATVVVSIRPWDEGGSLGGPSNGHNGLAAPELTGRLLRGRRF